jgi:hypothetical protein
LKTYYLEKSSTSKWLSENDYFWELLNRMILVRKDSLTNFHNKNVQVYNAMGRFVSEFEGKKGHQYMRLANQEYLQTVRVGGLKMQVMIIAHPRCKYSMQFHLRKYNFPLDVELPVPSDECEFDCCGCSISAAPERDKNGRLIWI